MQLSYADIAEHVDAGKTASEILAILQADTRHVRDIMATSSKASDTDLLDLLGSEFGVLRLSASAEWKGSLVDYFVANPDSPLRDGFELLLTQLQISDRPVRCGSVARIGALTTGLTEICKSLVGDHDAVQTAMDAITGGLRFAGVTLANVQGLLDQQDRLTAYESVTSRHNRGETAARLAMDAGQTPEQIVSAAVAAEAE